MSTSWNQAPAPGGRGPSRPDRRLVPGALDALEPRGSVSTLGVSARAFVPAGPARPGPSTVEVSGAVAAAGRVAPVAVAVVRDGDAPGASAVLPVSLVATGKGRYAYDLPLDLPAGHADGRGGGHSYSVTVVVSDPTGTANASAGFTRPGAPARPKPRRIAPGTPAEAGTGQSPGGDSPSPAGVPISPSARPGRV